MDLGHFVFVIILLLMVQDSVQVDVSEEWTKYKAVFNKTYVDDDEETLRRSIWEDNFRRIDQHNNAASKGFHRFWVKMNHLGDMTTDEINLIMNKLKTKLMNKAPSENTKTFTSIDQQTEQDFNKQEQEHHADVVNVTNVPDRIDWRKKGYVTAVKYQGHCGSCYAFSATGALEGQHFRKTGKLVSLSEQNIVDCTFHNKYRDRGCHGGLMDHAFRYVIDVGGVDTESSYPYEARVGKCRFKSTDVGATARNYIDIFPRGDEIKLKEAVGRFGPVSVGIDAHGFGFHFYSHGIYDSWFCSHLRLNHGMLVVGYDSDCSSAGCTDQDYWIVKNSWGTGWGLDGYVKMARNKNNQCGIATLASVPIV